MANVLFINPPQVYRITQIASGMVPPIGAAYIAAYLRENGHNVQFIDALGSGMEIFSKRYEATLRGLTSKQIIERIPKDIDIIGITNLFSHAWPLVRDLAQKIKRLYPDIPIVLGGIHPTAIPEFVLSHDCVDYVAIGEGEVTMLKLVNCLEKNESVEDIQGLGYMKDGKEVVNEMTVANLIDDLDILPRPAYDLIPIKNYINAKSPHGASRGKSVQMIATRGCPYTCTFCTAPKMWLPKWRSRSPKNVVDEMEYWNKEYEITDFHFEDLTMIYNRRWALEFSEEIIKSGLKVTWQMPNGTRAEIFKNKDVVDALSNCGCSNVAFAPESGCKKTLELIEKKLELNDIVEGSKRLLEKKMVVCGFFAIGFPHDTLDDIKQSFKFMRKLAWIGVHEISITTFTALPGALLFYKLLDEGKIELTDEFFAELLYMSDLSKAKAWMPGVSNAKLAHLRRWGYFQFFFVSYLRRPWRFVASAINILRGVENNKVERVGHAKICDAFNLLKSLFMRGLKQS